jgi:hypothetical protein
MTDLMKHIDQMVVDNTFSLDALEGIKKLKDEFAKLESELALAQENAHKAYLSENKALEQRDAARDELDALRKQVAEDNDTVNAARAAIANADKQAAVAAAYKDAMQIVFKPTVLRENIYRNTSSGLTTSNESTTITKEEA